MRLGVTYNVFDGEELLQRSIEAIRPAVDYVCVVYQTTSNFGAACHPGLLPLLQRLVDIGLVQDLIPYTPRTFSRDERQALVSPYTTMGDIGGSTTDIADQYFNELTKRELGRLKCLENGCNYFMSMDCDEYYRLSELEWVKSFLESHPVYDGGACRMRFYYKSPRWELRPLEERNFVPMIYRNSPKVKFLLAHPYPVLVDPTRTLFGVRRYKIFERSEVEMHHYFLVRTREGLRSKLANVSNRSNYAVEPERFLAQLLAWSPSQQEKVPPPQAHPYYAAVFARVEEVPNEFDIPELLL